MASLTIAIDDVVLRRARVRAVEQGTSVNALLRDYLVSYAESGAESVVRRQLADLARMSTARSSGPRDWTRADLYERGER